MKTKIEIKNRWFGTVLFTYEKENNTIKDTLLEAIKSEADLYGADLYGAYLRGADLRGAYLYEADLNGAYLYEADLNGADLRGANLRGADLRGANLRGANLRGADLRGAYIYVDDNEIDEKEVIKNFEEKTNIKIKGTYINKYIYPTRCNCFLNNGLIITEWEVKETKSTK